MNINGATAIIKVLEKHNVDTVFGYPGAAIAPFYDALYNSDIKHVLVRQEQNAAHAASGYAKATSRVGVCTATSGPGATNLITGIATAYMDSIPLVVITGQVDSALIGKDVFQEADITGATAPFCKHNYLVKDIEKIPKIMNDAFMLASTGRPGPVLIDVPEDVLQALYEFEFTHKFNIPGYKYEFDIKEEEIKKICSAIEKSKKPLIIAGGGVRSSKSHDILYKISKELNIPIAITLMAKGCIDDTYINNLGMLGSHGTFAANNSVSKADLLLIVGARVGDRSMNPKASIKNNTIIHIDIDPAEHGKNINVDYSLTGDAKDALTRIYNSMKKKKFDSWFEYKKKINELDCGFTNREDTINPKDLLEELSKQMGDKAIITTEVGQHQIWAANLLTVKTTNTFITSGGMGTMGYGLPAGVGAKIACNDKQVIVIAGDGSLQMGLQELGTIAQEGIDVKVLLFNNSSLGMVREVQAKKYNKRYSGTDLNGNPNFIKLFESYGFTGERLNNKENIEDAVKKMLLYKGTYILECIVDEDNPTIYR